MSYIQNDEEQVKEYSHKFQILYLIIAISIISFSLRLWVLQIFKGTEFRIESDQNRIKKQKVLAPRGMILDKEGRILVDNQPGFDVVITPQYAHKLEETAEFLAKAVGVDPKDVVRDVKQGRRKDGAFKPVVIKRNLTRDEVARVERVRFNHPGLMISMPIKRTYNLNENGAQFFGYVSEISKRQLEKYNKDRSDDLMFKPGDFIGQSGIELRYDDYLRGKDGVSFVQVDAFGREAQVEVPEGVDQEANINEPVPGNSLILTIDKDIQEAAYKAFNGTDRIGGVVAIDNRNGKILAWVNGPSFDPAQLTDGNWKRLNEDPFKPLRNKVVQDRHSPGSTFKVITAIAALEEKVVNKNTTHYCPGYLKFGRRQYHCHAKSGHGNVNIIQAIERSCNVFFFKMGIALGIDRIAKYAKALGFGVSTGIEMSEESLGLMPDSAWKLKYRGEEWQPGENLSNAIGQGFTLSTPLQLGVVFSGIANGGPIFKPYFVDKIVNVDGRVIKQNEPIQLRNPANSENTDVKISKETYALIQEGLWKVANGEFGTAKWHKIPGVELSGKSGTTQLVNLAPDQIYVKCHTRPIQQRHHGWYVGYAPYKNPEITVAVLAEHSCSGSGGAAPVFRDVVKAYMEKYHPELFETKRVANAEGVNP